MASRDVPAVSFFNEDDCLLNFHSKLSTALCLARENGTWTAEMEKFSFELIRPKGTDGVYYIYLRPGTIHVKITLEIYPYSLDPGRYLPLLAKCYKESLEMPKISKEQYQEALYHYTLVRGAASNPIAKVHAHDASEDCLKLYEQLTGTCVTDLM